jgi:hypothetical protein
VDEAKLLAKQIRQYARENGLSTSPVRNVPPSVVITVDAKGNPFTDGKVHHTAAEPTAALNGCKVTFRFAKPRAAKTTA